MMDDRVARDDELELECLEQLDIMPAEVVPPWLLLTVYGTLGCMALVGATILYCLGAKP